MTKLRKPLSGGRSPGAKGRYPDRLPPDAQEIHDNMLERWIDDEDGLSRIDHDAVRRRLATTPPTPPQKKTRTVG
jgi:hypothetical protein